MTELSLCPIIELSIASDDNVLDEYLERGFQKTKSIPSLSSEAGGGHSWHFVYSKNATIGTLGRESHDPIISSAINSGVPCFGRDKDRLILESGEL